MTTREDFEKWYRKENNLPGDFKLLIDSEGNYVADYVHSEYQAWQACAAHYEAKIALYEAAKQYDEAPDGAEFEPPHPIFQLAQERDNYAEQIRNLLALLAEKDKALKDIVLSKPTLFPYYELQNIAQHALSLTHDSVRLNHLGWVMTNGKFTENSNVVRVHDIQNDDKAVSVYTIVKGE